MAQKRVEQLEREAKQLMTQSKSKAKVPTEPDTPQPKEEPKAAPDADLLEQALGPEDGPGSGGRKKIAALSEDIHPRGHRVFLGAYDPFDVPKSMPERLIRMTPMAKRVLPSGDFRDWDEIEAWAREIASELTRPVLVG